MLVADDGRADRPAAATASGPDFGPYRVEHLVARGGMGEVYRAVDTRYGRVVALKVLPPSLSENDQFRERFQREAYLTAQLREPHVVPIHGFGEIDGRLYLDMRLIDGEDLARVLRRSGRLDPTRTLRIVEQVAQALDAAHREGLVHRDVKPSNVIVSAHDFVYLVDFGIARSASEGAVTSTGAVLGTWDYMAPERFRGDDPAPAADVYSLACLLVECLTGRPPYPARDMVSAMHAHVSAPPPQVATFGVPRALDAVVATGLAKEPAARFASPTALVHAAARALGRADTATAVPTQRGTRSLPRPVAPSPPHSTQPGRTTGRWVVPAALIAVVLAAVALAAVFLVPKVTPSSTASATGGSAAPVPSASVGSTATEAVTLVRDYYGLVPTHLEEGWATIGPTLRLRGGGYPDYVRHWSRYSQVGVLDAQASGPMSVRATIQLLDDGSDRTVETHDLRLVRDADGHLLIDADTLVRSDG